MTGFRKKSSSIPTKSSPGRINRRFFDRGAEMVAKDLLGHFLVRDGKKYLITETEAYLGPHDLASHSRSGPTARNAVMFGPPGRAYVYLIYGLHHCLNVVTGQEGHGAAVLIRSVAGITGPGKLCRELKIDRGFNGLDLTRPGPLYFAVSFQSINPELIRNTPRIGVKYAGSWADKPLRYELLFA